MAYYAALVSLVQLLEDIIHRDQYPNFLFDKQQIASVHEKFSHLQASLDDYSPKDKEAADFLERRIRDAAHRAQDIIEFHISNQMPQQLQKLEELKDEINSIAEELLRIKESRTTQNLQLNYYSAGAGTSNQAASRRNTTEGFEERLTTIKGQLCGEPSKLRVVSVVGMGGIGKTTLARNIFDDELIVHRFDCRAWVTVSQDYHLRKILLDIIDSLNMNNEKLRAEEEGVLGEHLYKHLKGRRYLIIVDDIWDTKVWDDIRRILPGDCNGSRIMLTTRISDVAFYADRFGFYHQMQFLDVDQSWNLFLKKVHCPPELEDIGRSIANNCRGLPLAIVVVAGFLSKVNETRIEWKEIAKNVSSAATENYEHFSKVLSLSYNHLPHHLKPCYLYLGGFPEDYKIRVSILIKLWVAEGFLKPIASKSLEEVAEEYLEDLVSRNLVLITEKRSNGKFKCCSIHDVLRDLCIQRVRRENFHQVLDQKDNLYPEAKSSIRRLYIHPDKYFIYRTLRFPKDYGSYVRSILCFRNIDTFTLLSFASAFKLLRVLKLQHIYLTSLANEIVELFHLRFLALPIDAFPIPPSISKLHNLQTLIVGVESVLQERDEILPPEIWKMPNLRHVIVCYLRLSPIPFASEASTLENLRTLSRVVDVSFSDEVVEMIPDLLKLKVRYTYEGPGKWQKFCLYNLDRLYHLETLDISFSGNLPRVEIDSFPESFAFPQKLKKLCLGGCRLPWKDLTVVGSLPKLQVLKLRARAFVGEEWEPIEGEFRRLEILLLESLDLKYWRAEYTHFPYLQHLQIRYCGALKEIPSGIGDIPTLQLIEVHFNKLAAESALRMQEEQRDLGNDVFQVRVQSLVIRIPGDRDRGRRCHSTGSGHYLQ